MKIRNTSLKYISTLEIAGSTWEDKFNTCWIFNDFLTCWVFYQTFKIDQRTKIFDSLITHCIIEVTHEYKVIINL